MATIGTKTFASLLRYSNLIALGDFRGATISGRVFKLTNNEMYVDIGMKFHAVVKRPRENRLFVRGSIVKLKLLDYEITDRFIGSSSDTSLLEADAVLLDLESSPVGKNQTNKS